MGSDYAKCLPGPQSPSALQMLISELSPQQQWWRETNLWSPEFAHSLVATGRLFLRSLGQGRGKGGLPGTCIGTCSALQVSAINSPERPGILGPWGGYSGNLSDIPPPSIFPESAAVSPFPSSHSPGQLCLSGEGEGSSDLSDTAPAPPLVFCLASASP